MLYKGLLLRLCRAREKLSAIEESPPSVEQLADELGISLYHFIRLFSAVFGETPHQYQIRIKLDKAKYLLAATDCSVTQVCMEIGYSSVGSFSDLFSRRVGMAPSAYRRKLRPKAQTPQGAPKSLTPGCFSLMCGTHE